MTEEEALDALTPAAERKLAIRLFNATWELMGQHSRTEAENDTMIHLAHASRYHWGQVGEPANLWRGEWQVSRVYALLLQGSSALYHAQRCLRLCEMHGAGDWDLAFAYEAVARAYAALGFIGECRRYRVLAHQSGEEIIEPGDRDWLRKNMVLGPWYGQASGPGAAEFHGAFPIGETDVMALPVKELAPAVAYYTRLMGFQVVSREETSARLKRDAAEIGLACSGSDPEQASVYFSVVSLEALHTELTEMGLEPSAIGPSTHDGRNYRVFFAKEPYGVCFCFGQIVTTQEQTSGALPEE